MSNRRKSIVYIAHKLPPPKSSSSTLAISLFVQNKSLSDKTVSRRVAGPGSESERGKNPAKPMKLRDMKKTGVKDSRTQLKKEKVVEEAMAQLQLDEENTTTPKSQPLGKFGGPFKFTVPCEVCGVVGHYNDRCPYIEVGLPDNVTEAPKGYEIVNLRGGKRAVRIMFCGCCKMLRDHKIKDCPNKSKMTAIMNSILKAARPPAGPLSSGSC